MTNPYLPANIPLEAEIIERITEGSDLITLRLKLTDNEAQKNYSFQPGQFNMLYLYGVGEVPISIVSDPVDDHIIDHTIRIVGRVTRGIEKLAVGDKLGLRGPYGRGWPCRESEGKDIVVITGGLGCAPVVSVINYIEQRRDQFGQLNIIQGVKHSDDLIWKERYDHWREQPNTHVQLAADVGSQLWPWHVGLVTELFDQMQYNPDNVAVMMCGPEGMMHAASNALLEKNIKETDMFLSMERNMQCAIGHCGHCQFGSAFVCKDGPVFSYDQIRDLFKVRGF